MTSIWDVCAQSAKETLLLREQIRYNMLKGMCRLCLRERLDRL